MRRLVPILLLPIAFTGCIRATIEPAKSQANTGLVVTGIGKIEAKPDTLVVSLGVSIPKPTPQEAFAAVTKAAAAMTTAVLRAKVADEDVRTTNLNVYPRYDRRGRVNGHTGSESFQVKIRKLDRGGVVIAAAVRAGGRGVTVNSVSLSIGDTTKLRDDARRKAITDARNRGEALAATADVTLGDPISIQEGGFSEPQQFFPIPRVAFGEFGGAASAGSAAGAIVGPDLIRSGTQTVEVRVTVRFALG